MLKYLPQCLLSFIFVYQAGCMVPSQQAGKRSISSNRQQIIGIHPSTAIPSEAVIKEYFSALGYSVFKLKDVFSMNVSEFHTVTCVSTSGHSTNSMGMHMDFVECTAKNNRSNLIVFQAVGESSSFIKTARNYQDATRAALTKFPSLEIAYAEPNPSKPVKKLQNQNAQTHEPKNNEIIRSEISSPINKLNISAKETDSIIPQLAGQNRTALIVGNAEYQFLSPLKNPENDAHDLTEKLKQLGFSVTLLLNASQEKMEDEIRIFGRQLIAKGGVGLFFYAGHGVQVAGQNFLIPVDAKIMVQKDVKYKAVYLSSVMDEMGEARNGFNVIILDACRDNPLPSGSRSLTRGLAQVNGPKGSFIAFATAPGETASDGAGRNGVFTKYLLKNIATKGASVESVFKNIAKGVAIETSSKQTPWVNSSFIGDFYFAP